MDTPSAAITATVEIADKFEDGKRVKINATAINQEGTIVLSGDGIISPPRKKASV